MMFGLNAKDKYGRSGVNNVICSQKRSFINLLSVFSVLYVLVAVSVFLPYWSHGCSLICSGDAAGQHYPALSYYGMYLRQGLKNLLSGQTPIFPTWDMSIGLGGDIVTTLHYYCLGDPLALISALFPLEHMELCYTILIFLRLYISGITAIIYFNYHNAPKWSSVLGALIYSFSGYAISAGVFHPFFSIPMMYLPLLLLGVDLIFEGKSPKCFILTVTVALLSNFYFFYMLVLITVGYVLLRYFAIYRKFNFCSIFKYIVRFFCYAVIGMLMAMPVFLPNIISLISSSRLSVSRDIPLLYPLEYYRSLPAAIISDYGNYYVYISVSAVAVVALFVLFSLRKKNKHIFIMIATLLAGICLLIPKIGSVFNGFAYVTNRWIWALTFIFAYITAMYLPKAVTLERKELIKFCLLVFGYCVLCLLPNDALSRETVVAIIALCVLSGLVIATHFKQGNGTVFRRISALVCVATLIFNGYYHATNERQDWIGNHQEVNSIYGRYWNSNVSKTRKLPMTDVNRIDSESSAVDYNAAFVNRVYGTSFYFSTVNTGTASFQHSQMLNTQMDQQYRGLNNRSYLMAALGVEYYITKNKKFTSRPYGFDVAVTDKIYSSENKSKIVYTFDTVCTDSEALSVTQKQQALLQCAMTEEAYGLPEAKLNFSDAELPYVVSNTDESITQGNKQFAVGKSGDSVTLNFDDTSHCELYVCFENLEFIPADSKVTETKIQLFDSMYKENLNYKTPQNNYSSGRTDFLVNMGYSSDERNSVTLTFTKEGTYTFSDLRIVSQPMDNFEKQVYALANSGISDIKVEKSVISFNADKANDSIACVAIPYQKGWSVTVDGKDADVLEIQDGLCGIYLDAGEHQVVMTYKTPALNLGWIMFSLGLALFCLVVFLQRKNK